MIKLTDCFAARIADIVTIEVKEGHYDVEEDWWKPEGYSVVANVVVNNTVVTVYPLSQSTKEDCEKELNRLVDLINDVI